MTKLMVFTNRRFAKRAIFTIRKGGMTVRRLRRSLVERIWLVVMVYDVVNAITIFTHRIFKMKEGGDEGCDDKEDTKNGEKAYF